MIHYQLRCNAAHEFDGWFRNSSNFDDQVASGLLECPICGCQRVERALMTPSVRRRGAPRVSETEIQVAEPVPPAQSVLPPLPDELRAVLQRVRAEVEQRCDYVGGSFADEARRIHRGETAARGIYGETSDEEAESLADEGIEFSQVPWVRRAEG